MAMTEAEQVCALMDSVLNGERTCDEVSEILEINLGVVQRVAARMTEQLLGLPPTPIEPEDWVGWGATRFFAVMRRRW